MSEYIFLLAGMATGITMIILLEIIEERRNKTDERG